MATQNAVVVSEVGKPAVLVQREIPQPGPNQVQVKVSVAGLNPHDQKTRDMGLLIWTEDYLPYCMATDVVGTVSALGSSVTSYQFGDRVVGYAVQDAPGSNQAGMQQYALANVGGTLCKIPDSMSDDEAATMPCNLGTTWVAIFLTLGVKFPWVEQGEVPERLVIIGGGANCGQYMTQLAKFAGIRQIVVVGGKEAELKSLGATDVIDRHIGEDAIVKQIKDITNDKATHVLDAVNMPEGLPLAFKALSSTVKGKVARLLPMGVLDDEVKQGHELIDVMFGRTARSKIALSMWEKLPSLIENGDIKPRSFVVHGGLEAEVVNGALDEYRDGTSKGQPHVHIA